MSLLNHYLKGNIMTAENMEISTVANALPQDVQRLLSLLKETIALSKRIPLLSETDNKRLVECYKHAQRKLIIISDDII